MKAFLLFCVNVARPRVDIARWAENVLKPILNNTAFKDKNVFKTNNSNPKPFLHDNKCKVNTSIKMFFFNN